MILAHNVVVSFVVETSSPLLLQSNEHVLHVLVHVSSLLSTVSSNIENKLKIHYASVRMRRRHTVVGLCMCVCVCICMSVTRVSRILLQARHCRVHCRHNATISQI